MLALSYLQAITQHINQTRDEMQQVASEVALDHSALDAGPVQ